MTETSPQTARGLQGLNEFHASLEEPAVEGDALAEALAAFVEEVRACRVSVNMHGRGFSIAVF